MRSNLAFEGFDFQIGHSSNQSGVGAFGQIGSILVPADRCLEIFLLLVQRTQTPRKIDILRFLLVVRVLLSNLLIERFSGQPHAALLLE